ncbi:maestro heat-like repeat family member 5 isoform X1 [Vidua chalybeata]|uniref:maestro heat-like repeat family member 5 isoform X1 n=1 Tax=Vidua chalybeata TaxID=81927 RepID=UPI0023A82A74|nr:maestro heat-like repeat family member 5 isoform X1 [Vidua chalybeata]
MEQRSLRGPKLAWVQEEEEGPGAAPIEEIKEVVRFKTLQEDAAVDRTQEQDPARGLFRRTVEVPAMVRYIHQWLMDNQFAEQRLNRALLDLTEEQPGDVVMTLLCVAPSCDRAAFTMWKSIMCSPRTAEPVQLMLLDVLGSWPEHSTFTSDGDKTGVFVLAATLVMWKILQVPCVPQMVTVYFPHLLVHLLFQVFFSTLDMPEEVNTFWKGCQQQYGLATSPSRFAVRTLKSLLCQMEHEDVVLAMERKRGWDTLLCADTHHYAVGLLAREISRVSIPLCSRIARYLLQLLSTLEPRWELPALAFLVEVLECLNLSGGSANRVLQILSRHLHSKCRDRRRLALRALLKLIDNPSMSEKMGSLTESLVELLCDADGEIVSMTVTLLSFISRDKDMLIGSSIALRLVEALLPLFDHDNSQVQLLSILLFQTLLSLPLEKDKKALKTHVHESLLPLFFHCHDENGRVAQVRTRGLLLSPWEAAQLPPALAPAGLQPPPGLGTGTQVLRPGLWGHLRVSAALQASQETLLCVAHFLKRRDLEKVVKKKKLWKFTECLLADDSSRAAEHLRQAMPYLESPEEPLREAAIRFLGMAGRQLRGKKEELQLICEALEGTANDISVAVGSLAIQTLYILQAVERAGYSLLDSLHDQLRRAWRTRPRLLGLGWLRCRSCAEC